MHELPRADRLAPGAAPRSRPYVAPVMNIFVPVTRRRPLCRSMTVRTRPRSQPASGSVAPKIDNGLPAASPGRWRPCCAGVPKTVSAATAPIDE
ncbi:MAG: hypothetical protein EBR23_04850 [Planctomycetia bacterium]|nr:hypothetical protein [Planctomycetia bacterium]